MFQVVPREESDEEDEEEEEEVEVCLHWSIINLFQLIYNTLSFAW